MSGMAVAAHTVVRSIYFDRALNIDWQIIPRDPAVRARFDRCTPGMQTEVYRYLLEASLAEGIEPARMAVLGDGLVGKSTVLRRLARKLAADYLSDAGGSVPLPILLPMKQVQIEPIMRGEDWNVGEELLHRLLRYWCVWANELTYENAVNPEWLAFQLDHGRLVIIFDGVDEFLQRNDWATIEHFRSLMEAVQRLYHTNGGLKLILGVRSTQRRLNAILDVCDRSYEVLPLTNRQIETVGRFVKMRELIAATNDPSTQELLRRPISINWLGSQVEELLKGGRIKSQAEVYLAILRAIVRSRGLTEQVFPAARGGHAEEDGNDALFPSIDVWVDALAVISWLFFKNFTPVLSLEVIRVELQRDLVEWQKLCTIPPSSARRNGAADPFSTVEPGIPPAQMTEGEWDPLPVFTLLLNHSALEMLFNSTILFNVGANRFRMMHEELEQFLVARYLALFIRGEFFSELRHRAFSQVMCQIAGTMLEDSNFSYEKVNRAIQGWLSADWEPRRKELMIAAFFSLVGNTRPRLDGIVFDLLERYLPQMPAIAHLVTFTSFGQWALSTPRDEQGSEYLRRRVHGMLQRFFSGDAIGVRNPLIRSLVWCLLKAMFKKFGVGVEPKDPPALGTQPEHVNSALEIMGRSSETQDPFHRSLQSVFTEIQRVVLYDSDRPVSVAHFLYCVCSAIYRGAPIKEVVAELGEIFREGSEVGGKIQQKYQEYAVLEVFDLYCTCKRMWEESGGVRPEDSQVTELPP
jgi:hypothetical protein